MNEIISFGVGHDAAGEAIVVAPAGAITRDVHGYVRIYLDCSTSMRIVKGELAQQFNNFLLKLKESWSAAGGDPEKLEIAIKVFNREVKRLGQFKPVGKVDPWNARTYDKHAAFGTALRDAVSDGAVKSVAQLNQLASSGLKLYFGVVVLSDGQDSASKKPLGVVRGEVDEASARGVQFRFVFVGPADDQVLAHRDAGTMGFADGTIATGEKTAEGMDETFTQTARTMFTDPRKK